MADEAAGLDNREQKLLDREKELNARFQELDEQFKSLCERTGAPESGDLDDQLRALQGDGDALKAERDELETLRKELGESRDDQSKREDEFKERERDLDRHRAALANQELDLEHRRNEFRQREEAAEQLHTQYAEQEKAVEARRKGFDQRQKELDEQREAIELQIAWSVAVFGHQMTGPRFRKFGISYANLHPMSESVRQAFIDSRSTESVMDVVRNWYDPTRQWSQVERPDALRDLIAAGAG